MEKIVSFFQTKPVSITAFVGAVMNLLAVLGVDPFTNPDALAAMNVVLSTFLGLFVTKMVTANARISDHVVDSYNGVN